MSQVKSSWSALTMLVGLLLFLLGWAYAGDDPVSLIKEADGLAEHARTGEDVKSALEKYELAADVLRKAGNRLAVGQVCMKIGRIRTDWSEYQKADSQFKEALACAKDAGDSSLEAETLAGVGVMHLFRGEMKDAQTALENALSIARRIQDSKTEAYALNHLGSVQRITGFATQAMENVQRSIHICETIQDNRGQARSLTNAGWLLFWEGKSTEAKNNYERSLAMSLESGDLLQEGWTRLNLSDMYRQLGKTAQAMDEAAKALQIGKLLGNLRLEAYGWNSLGLAHESRGDYEAAIDSCRKALPMAEKVEDPILRCNVTGNEGIVWRDRNQHDKSSKLSEKALEIARTIPFPWAEANQLHNLGMDFAAAKQYTKALDSYQQALKIRQRINDTRYAVMHLNAIGLVFMDTGRIEEAGKYFQETLRSARAVGNRQTEGWALNNLGEVSRRQGDYRAAIERYQEALALAREIQYPKLEEFALINMGRTYMTQGNTAKAIELARQVQALKSRGKQTGSDDPASLVSEGDAYLMSGQYPKAVQCYEKALKAARESRDPKTEASALTSLGMARMVTGKYKASVESYEEAYKLVSKSDDAKAQATILVGLFGVLSATGQHVKAAEASSKLLKLEPKLDDPQAKAAILAALTLVNSSLGGRGKATDFSGKLSEITEVIKDPAAKVTLLLPLSQTNSELGHYDKAEELAEKAADIAVRSKYALGQTTAFNLLGNIRENAGKYAKAAEAYNRALSAAKDAKDPKCQLVASTRLGVLYHWWGRYNDALESFRKAQETSRKISDHMADALCSNYIGEVYKSLGAYDKARSCFEAALTLAGSNNDPRTQSSSLIAIGEVAERQDLCDEAVSALTKAVSLRKQLKMSNDYANSVLCHLYLNLNKPDKAEPYAKEAGSAPCLGRLYLTRGDYAKAKDMYSRFAASAERSNHVDDLFVAYTGLGLCSENTGDLNAAAELFRKAVDLTEELRSSLSPEQKERFFDVRVHGFYRTAPYEGLARVLTRLNRAAEGWTVSEYTKARVFSETISRNRARIRSDAPDEVVEADAALAEELAALKQKRQEATEKDDQPRIKLLNSRISALTDKFNVHVKMCRTRYPVFAAINYPEPVDLKQTALGNDQWVVSYDVTDAGLLIYLTRGKELVKGLFKPVAGKDLDELVQRFRQPMEVSDSNVLAEQLERFDFASGKKLTDILLADVLPLVPKGAPLIIVPDGSLGVLPFEMLTLSDGGKVEKDKERPNTVGAEFLGDRNPISYYQSVTALTLQRRLAKHQKAKDRLLVMADPVFDTTDDRVKDASQRKRNQALTALPETIMSMTKATGLTFPRLPLTGELADSLMKVDPDKTDLYRGIQATKAALLKSDFKSCGSVVFATHGYFGKDLPGIMEPVLVLTLVDQPEGQDGFLRLSEVMGLKMDVDIVALTACQTGLGKHISGEGTMGMGRAFQYAGAKSVLMSLWSVSQKASVKLVESFFRNLKEGKNKMEALKLARQEIREQGFDHPFYWAPFILVGEVN